MKRFHVHVAVEDLSASVRFYSSIFGVPPTILKHDYAKWMVEDPRLNFAISSRGVKPGIDHLGMQVDSDEELQGLRQQVANAEIAAFDQKQAACCYAQSNKYWITDPQGVAWETYHTLAQAEIYGTDIGKTATASTPKIEACCAPQSKSAAGGESKATKASCC